VAASERAYALAAETLERTGIGDTNSGRLLYNDWVRVRVLTNPQDALALHARVIHAPGSTALGDWVTARDLIAEGDLLNRVARYQEARAILERARAIAERSPLSRALATMALVTTCRSLGDLECAARTLHEVEAPYASDPYLLARRGQFLLEQARQAAARGERDAAGRMLLEALAIEEKDPNQHIPRIETLHALARLELAGDRTAEAERHARAALGQAEGVRGEARYSAWVGLSQLVMAEVAQARGDDDRARHLYTDAAAHLAPTLGEAHPAVEEARAGLAAGARRRAS